MGGPTGFGHNGDYIFGWEDDSLDRAMAHCNNRGARRFQGAYRADDKEINGSTQPVVVDEITEGEYLPALPRCNPIQTGPELAAIVSGCAAVSTTGFSRPTAAAPLQL